MRDFLESKEKLLKKFHSNASKGLTEEQAIKNRRAYGANVLTKQKRVTLLKRIGDAAAEPMLLMLIAAALIALGVNLFRSATGGGADYLECVGIFLAIALSVIISVVMEGRSAKAFEALSQISNNIHVKAIRGGIPLILNREDIVAGDILLLSTGDKTAADGRLLESVSLHVDESALTGESNPVEKNADSLFTDEKTPLAERSNMLYSGTYISGGSGKMLVTAVGDQTEFGKIARELDPSEKSSTPLQEKLAKLGKVITFLGITAAAIVFIAQWVSFAYHGKPDSEKVIEALITSIVLIVAAVPEGLPTIVAVSLSVNLIKLSRQHALVKKLIASETIGCINIICSDKTGTLTENKMTVQAFYDTHFHESPTELASPWMIHNICLNTTADLGENGLFVGNPSECAMLRFYEESAGRRETGKSYRDERAEHEILQAFPFSSDIKHMTSIAKVDGSIVSYVKGSPECVMAMCRPDTTQKEKLDKHIIREERKARRVIAFAHKELDSMDDYEQQEKHRQMETDMVFDGFVSISDPLRATVCDAVNSCREAAVSLKILTGDNIVTATAIANELHLLENGQMAVEATEITDLSDRELSEKLPLISVIARSTPTVKMRVVRLLKAQGNVVAVTGDGINDAPALKKADVGIAMGISGTEVSKEAGDIVLLDDSFATIVKAVAWGRNIYENIKRFIRFQLTVNMASVIVVFTSILLGLKAPFTALQLLWINIIMDGPPALTLGLEPPCTDLMKRRPTSRSESIVSKRMLGGITATALYISLAFLGQYAFNFLNASPDQMTTVLFTMFVLFQLFNAFNCREMIGGSVIPRLLKNKPMLGVIGCTFVLQVLITQFAGAFFGTVPLGLCMWLKLFLISSTVVVIPELVTLILRTVKQEFRSHGSGSL